MLPLVSRRIATRFGPENSFAAVISNGLRSNSAVKVLALRSCGTSPCESRIPTGMTRFVHGASCAHNEHARRRISVTPVLARTIEGILPPRVKVAMRSIGGKSIFHLLTLASVACFPPTNPSSSLDSRDRVVHFPRPLLLSSHVLLTVDSIAPNMPRQSLARNHL
jgi:hypothetical protein